MTGIDLIVTIQIFKYWVIFLYPRGFFEIKIISPPTRFQHMAYLLTSSK